MEEWQNVDLLALDTWASGEVIGYEVKVSRSDYRQELLKPYKRAKAVSMCTRFYFAVPAGLLTPDELDYEEPEWIAEDFERQPCSNPDCRAGRAGRGFLRHHPKPRGSRVRGTDREGVTVHLGFDRDKGTRPDGSTYTHAYEVVACCTACKGYGHTAKSRVEIEAPTLWVPRDVGLVAVGGRGCSVIREAPRRKVTEPIIPWPFVGFRGHDNNFASFPVEDASRLERAAIAQIVRWASFRPDPRHTRSYSDTVEP